MELIDLQEKSSEDLYTYDVAVVTSTVLGGLAGQIGAPDPLL